MAITKLENGAYWITKGTLFPFLCKKCDNIVDYEDKDWIKCPHCGHEGPRDEFDDVEWEFTERKVN
jgi:endogenous inhibitor of DNA gyrase (YacG/DUF329 family)